MGEPAERKPVTDDLAAMAFIEKSPLCAGLDEQHLNALIDAGQAEMFTMGTTIFEQGQAQDVLYLIMDGSVQVVRSNGQAAPKLVVQLERSAVFGEMAVLTQREHSASAIAESDVRAIAIDGDTVRRVADASTKFGRKLAALMAGRSKQSSA